MPRYRISTKTDSPHRVPEIQKIIGEKASLRHFYQKTYRSYAGCLSRCPKDGIALEIGSGGGFAKELLPEIVTSDIVFFPGMDLVVDPTSLPFADESLRIICLTHLFHHLPDVERFLAEAQRCLARGGRLIIADRHLGIISGPILRYLHRDHCDHRSPEWSIAGTGRPSRGNGALPWIVFVRDRVRVATLFPRLVLSGYRPHSPLFYWLCGGLGRFNLIPRASIATAEAVDRLLLALCPDFGSFTDIELVKR